MKRSTLRRASTRSVASALGWACSCTICDTSLSRCTQFEQHTFLALRIDRPAGLSAVLDQQQVHRVSIAWPNDLREDLLGLLRRGARGHELEPPGDAMDVRIDGKHRLAEREQQRARRRLGTDSLEPGEILVTG